MSSTFDAALDAFDAAQLPYLNGDPGPVIAVFSRRDDVTLCNPVGPPCRGPEDVDRAAAEPSSHFADGTISSYDEISRVVTDDLAYVVRVERGQARIDDSTDPMPYALRATMIFRLEGDTWKIAHRHADPLTTPRPLDSIVERQD